MCTYSRKNIYYVFILYDMAFVYILVKVLHTLVIYQTEYPHPHPHSNDHGTPSALKILRTKVIKKRYTDLYSQCNDLRPCFCQLLVRL